MAQWKYEQEHLTTILSKKEPLWAALKPFVLTAYDTHTFFFQMKAPGGFAFNHNVH